MLTWFQTKLLKYPIMCKLIKISLSIILIEKMAVLIIGSFISSLFVFQAPIFSWKKLCTLIKCGVKLWMQPPILPCSASVGYFYSLALFLILPVKLNANRVVIGTLRGFDQFMNLVVDNTVEVNGNDRNDIGMVVLRGNSVVMIEALEPIAKSQ